MITNNPELVGKQIDSIQNEILLIRFVFALVNSLSLFFLGFVLEKMNANPNTTNEAYISFLQAAIALFVPYLTIVTQGFSYPKIRKLNSLQHLMWKPTLAGCEIEMMYDK